MEEYIVSFNAIGCNYNSTTIVRATCEANAIAQVQLQGHLVHWACAVNLK